MRALIVEDEDFLADSLGRVLKKYHWQSDRVDNGADGVDYGLSGQYDVILLDVMLPRLDGFEVVRRLREGGNATPVLMLTARDDVSDKIGGLNAGADDYMTKPFDIGELMARINALTRRQGTVVMEQLTVGDVTLELGSRCLSRGEQQMRLGFKEFEIMRMLMASPKCVIPKEEIIARVWGLEADVEDNNVEVYISFLRKKLSCLGGKVSIHAARKVGYYLEAEES